MVHWTAITGLMFINSAVFRTSTYTFSPPMPMALHHASRVNLGRHALHTTPVCIDEALKAGGGVPSPPPMLTLMRTHVGVGVVGKPHTVPCHASEYVGKTRGNGAECYPLLQRARDALGVRVNLIHRLDRGASGCVLIATATHAHTQTRTHARRGGALEKTTNPDSGLTHTLQCALASESAVKTYVCITRGTGVNCGEDLKERGWFEEERAIKDYKGRLREANTLFKFLACIPPSPTSPRRASVVLARPRTGRWHQIRRHLNGLNHPILGDTSHGCSETNKLWRVEHGLPRQRIYLHLARIQLPATDLTPALDVSCPLPDDMRRTLLREFSFPYSMCTPTEVATEEGGVMGESHPGGSELLPWRAELQRECGIDLFTAEWK